MDVSFLRQTPLFRTLPDAALRLIGERGQLIDAGPGAILFEEGTAGLDVYVVKSGIVEILKRREGLEPHVVGYLSQGDCVGEMSIITGLLRSATVRVPHKAEVLRIPGETFGHILSAYAEVALSLAKILAYRLQIANQLNAEEKSKPTHLSGDLDFFDLPDVLQTLTQGRRTGIMRLRTKNTPNDVELWFDEGLVRHASAAGVEGKAALLWMFSRRLQGTFEFSSTVGYQGPTDRESLEESPMALLLEAARQRDEIDVIRARLPHADHVLMRSVDALRFKKPEPRTESEEEDNALKPWRPATDAELDLARRIWEAVGLGLSVSELIARFEHHEYVLHRVLFTLHSAKDIQ